MRVPTTTVLSTLFQGPVDVNKKKGCDWILVSHELVDSDDAWVRLEQAERNEAEAKVKVDRRLEEVHVIDATDNESAGSGILTLKFEPFILHVQCRDAEAAKFLHTQRQVLIA